MKKRLENMAVPSPEEIISSPFCFRAVLPGDIHVPEIVLPAIESTGGKTDDQALIESIGTHGIIDPPLYIRRDGENRIVTGHRRLAAASAAGLTATESLVIDLDIPEGPVPVEILNIWLESATRGSVLTDLERLILLSRADSLYERRIDNIMPVLSAIFGRNITAPFAGRLLTLLDLPSPIWSALHDGRMKTGDLLTLVSRPSIDVGDAAMLLLDENMSRGGMKKAIRLVIYLADQHGTGWKDVLVSSGGSDMPLTIRLEKACYPGLQKDTAKIAELIDSMGLPAEASINPPDNLEGGGYALNIRVRDAARFSVILDKLTTALTDGRIKRLLDILKGK